MYMSKVLITGAGGFVGRHLTKELTDNGYEVVTVDRSVKKSSPNSLQIDLNSAKAVEQIDFSEITAVMHLAGLAAVGPSFDDPMNYISTNVGIECNLFEEASKQGHKPKFLIVSTGALYDATAPLPLDENSRISPSSPYAVSKLGQEQLALYYTNRGFECVIARPFNHIGPGQGPGFIVPDIAQQVVECETGSKDEVLVGNLDAKRDYTDVRDIARAYRLLIEKGVSGEVYNICSGRALSGHEILEGIVGVVGNSPKIAKNPKLMRPADNPVIYGNNNKLKEATGWQPEIDIKQTLTDVVADWRSR
jgi:GDP-4-dehydro-6-deoxy-D-mannose reductase